MICVETVCPVPVTMAYKALDAAYERMTGSPHWAKAVEELRARAEELERVPATTAEMAISAEDAALIDSAAQLCRRVATSHEDYVLATVKRLLHRAIDHLSVAGHVADGLYESLRDCIDAAESLADLAALAEALEEVGELLGCKLVVRFAQSARTTIRCACRVSVRPNGPLSGTPSPPIRGCPSRTPRPTRAGPRPRWGHGLGIVDPLVESELSPSARPRAAPA